MEYLHNNKNILFIDLEMTGVFTSNPITAEIIEVAMIYIEDFEHNKEHKKTVFYEQVKPNSKINPYVSRMTGITNRSLSQKPNIRKYRDTIQKYVDKADLIVMHGGKIDKIALKCSGITLKDKWIFDTATIFKKLYPNEVKTNLTYAVEYFGGENKYAHNALSDVNATIDLFTELTVFSKEVWNPFRNHKKAIACGFSTHTN